jgi:two-component system sensor histidine kinase DegS
MRMVQAQEAERSRLARELHDGPTQVLANAVFQVEIIERLLDRDMGQARRELKTLRDTLDRELKAMRGYLNRLRPPVLEEFGLSGAIREQATQLEAMPGIPVTIALDRGLDELPESVELVIYRIVQEALQNIRKHALARKASVRATRLSRAWKIEVKDDGRGFDLDATRQLGTRNFGLQFMQERADMIGARFEVRSRRGGGTAVTLNIPWAAKENR